MAAIGATADFGSKVAVTSSHGMACTSHPLATRTAVEVLQAGGNACDAALAAALTQTVVEPHMTSITGRLDVLHWDAGTRTPTFVDGHVRVPSAGPPNLREEDLRTGRGVAVPGWVAAFDAAHSRHGRLAREDLFTIAIALARDGFPIHSFLYGEMFVEQETLGLTAEGRGIFMPQGALAPPGSLLRQERAATTLEGLRDGGSEWFHRGAFAKRLVDVVRAAGGVLSRDDLEAYEVVWAEPLRSTYRDFEVVTSAPPEFGGCRVLEALNMLETVDLPSWGPPSESPRTFSTLYRVVAEVFSRSWRDPESHDVPMATILSKEFARARLELVLGSEPRRLAGSGPGTCHVVVVDSEGNAVSSQHSCLSHPWTNGLFCEGVSVVAGAAHFLGDMPRPGCHASGNDTANLVFRGGDLVLASGSPSSSQGANVVQNLVNLLDFDLPIADAVRRPRFGVSFTGKPAVEGDVDPGITEELRRLGVDFTLVNPWNPFFGSFEAVLRDPSSGELSACADPRRCGAAESSSRESSTQTERP